MRHSILLILLIICATNIQAQDGWTLKSNKDNVKVYYKHTSDIHEIKLSTSIQTSLSGILTLFNEVELYPTWGYKVSEARMLKKVSDTEMYYYSKIDFPWPMDDRDVVMHTQLWQNKETKMTVSSSTAVGNYIPEVKDVIRMAVSNTKWVLTPGTNGWLGVEYYIYSNPGGTIPDWLINAAIDVGPRETIKQMRTTLQKPKYKSAKLSYIID